MNNSICWFLASKENKRLSNWKVILLALHGHARTQRTGENYRWMKVEDQLPNEVDSTFVFYSFPSIFWLWIVLVIVSRCLFGVRFALFIKRPTNSFLLLGFWSRWIWVFYLWLTSVFCSFKQLTGRIPVHSLFVCNNSLKVRFLMLLIAQCSFNWFEREREKDEKLSMPYNARMWILRHLFIFVRIFNGCFVY